jgi:hypothetical protein
MRNRATLVLALILAAVIGGGIARASIPAADGTINGCRKNADGSIKVIDSAATCGNGYTVLNWPSLAGKVATADKLTQVIQVYSASLTLDTATPNRDVFLLCPAGYKVVGGGVQDDQPFSGIPIVVWYSVPTVGQIGVGSEEAWRVGVSLPDGETERHFGVRVRCIAAASQTLDVFGEPGEPTFAP